MKTWNTTPLHLWKMPYIVTLNAYSISRYLVFNELVSFQNLHESTLGSVIIFRSKSMGEKNAHL